MTAEEEKLKNTLSELKLFCDSPQDTETMLSIISSIEKQFHRILSDRSTHARQMAVEFGIWYSGMAKEKVIKAFDRYQSEADTFTQSKDFCDCRKGVYNWANASEDDGDLFCTICERKVSEIRRLEYLCCGHDPDHKTGGKCEDCNGTGYTQSKEMRPLEEKPYDILVETVKQGFSETPTSLNTDTQSKEEGKG